MSSRYPPELKTCPKMEKVHVGMPEINAKIASNQGLEPPVILTDVYAGYFASECDGKWGIIEIDTALLLPGSFAPFHGYIEKLKRGKIRSKIEKRRQDYLANIVDYKKLWNKSLEDCGVYLYLATISPQSISKVTIFDPRSNKFITSKAKKVNPWEVTVEEHKDNYFINYCVASWLACSAVKTEVEKSKNYLMMLDDLNERSGLEIYHFQTVTERNKMLVRSRGKREKSNLTTSGSVVE